MYGFKIENTKEIGSTIECTAMEKSFGSMEDHIKVNINMIKNMDLALFNGRMAENMLEIGRMENSMDVDNITYRQDKKK